MSSKSEPAVPGLRRVKRALAEKGWVIAGEAEEENPGVPMGTD
jgi:hypothetical protein